MPVPVVLIAAAAVAGAFGIGGIGLGGVKTVQAKDREKRAKEKHQETEELFNSVSSRTNEAMDSLGRYELEVVSSFEDFSNLLEKIQNRPEFSEIESGGVVVPDFDSDEFKNLFVGARALLGGLTGAAAGVVGGVAASGATTAIVAAVGTASTGTAISALSGAAATNAILACLGGGSLAVGGGGMALGTVVLGSAAGGAALLVGGVIVGVVGVKLDEDSKELEKEIDEERRKVDEACELLDSICSAAQRYESAMRQVHGLYREHLDELAEIVEVNGKTDWCDFGPDEKLELQNTVLLVGLLYEMCKLNLVLKPEGNGESKLNGEGMDDMLAKSDEIVLSL